MDRWRFTSSGCPVFRVFRPNQSKPYYNLSTAYLIQAQLSLEAALQNMQNSDPGLSLVKQRIEGIKALSASKKTEYVSPTYSPGNKKGMFKLYMPSQE